jgi:enamine deaminase RidA (YjgF/YER057c/UK114 family)
MRKLVQDWLGHELVELSIEAQPGRDAAGQAEELFGRLDRELHTLDLSLSNTVRTRLWGRDRASRDAGSRERVAALTGAARSASSSFIAPDHFDSNADVAVDLWAVRPNRAGIEKSLVEYDPPIVPLRYLVYDDLVFLSGVTAVLPTLDDQVADILPRIEASLGLAAVGWEDVVHVSCLLHRSQRLDRLKQLLATAVDVRFPVVEYGFVDGYSSEGKLIEIEVTAKLGSTE